MGKRQQIEEPELIGYADRLSVAPGERVHFMVHCQADRFQADIVRLIHGDENPLGPGFKERHVETAVSGTA